MTDYTNIRLQKQTFLRNGTRKNKIYLQVLFVPLPVPSGMDGGNSTADDGQDNDGFRRPDQSAHCEAVKTEVVDTSPTVTGKIMKFIVTSFACPTSYQILRSLGQRFRSHGSR